MACFTATGYNMQLKKINTVPETADVEINVPSESEIIKIDCHLKNIVVAEGESCFLQVSAVGPNPTCVWFKNGRPIQETAYVTRIDLHPWFRLQLQITLYKDGGIYTAICKNRKSYATSQSVVYVIRKAQSYMSRKYCDTLYLPPFSLTVAKHLPNLKLKPGETIILLAEFQLKPNDSIKHYWFKNDELVSSEYVTTHNGSSAELIKTDAQFEDSGVYMVVAETAEGFVSSVSEVVIMDLEIRKYTIDPSFIDQLEQEIECREGEDVRLVCEINDQQYTTAHWYKGKQLLIEDANKIIYEQYGYRGIGLTIKKIEKKDADTYSVTLKNMNNGRTCSSSCVLSVNPKSNFRNEIEVARPLKTLITAIGTSVCFNCAFNINGRQYFYVIWNVGRYKIERSTPQFQLVCSGNEFLLYIKQVEPDMLGSVSCHLREVLSDQTTYEVNVTKAVLIQVPMAMIEDEVTNSYITSERICGGIDIAKTTLVWNAVKETNGRQFRDSFREGFSWFSSVYSRVSESDTDPSQIDRHDPDAGFEDYACGQPVKRQNGTDSITNHLDSDDNSKLYIISNDIPTISTDNTSSDHGAGAGTLAAEILAEVLYCRIENDGPNFLSMWNCLKNESVISMVVTKQPVEDHYSLILQWEQVDSPVAPADTWYSIDLCLNGGPYQQAGVTSLPMFEIKNPPAEKAILFRIRMGSPMEITKESMLVIEPPRTETSPPTRKYTRNRELGTYEQFQRSYAKTDGVLGCGAFGTVVLMTKSKEDMYAVKIVKTPTVKQKLRAIQEFELMTAFDHPRLVTVYEGFHSDNTFVFVMDYLWGGELFDRIVEEDNFNEATAVVYILQICEGLEYLHNKRIAHLDLKPENIVCINPNSRNIKLVDFGLSRVLNGQVAKGIYGTRDYLAPEVLNYDGYTTACDLWSLGVITYLMLTGRVPFAGDSWAETSVRISRALFSYGEDGAMLSSLAINFIDSLIVKEPKGRLTASSAKTHPWIAQPTNKIGTLTKQWRFNLKSHLALNKARWQRAANVVIAANRLRHLSNPFDTNSFIEVEEQKL